MVRADVCSCCSISLLGNYFFKVFEEQLVVLLYKYICERGVAHFGLCFGWYSLRMVLYISMFSCCSKAALSSVACEAW